MSSESSTQGVRAQYEAMPYPARDPADERKRLVIGSPGDLAEIRHYLFAGRLPARPLRVLFAGGGTGDGTIMLAQQMASAGVAGEVVYLDLSSASRHIAEQRAKARGLTNIRFCSGSLLDLAELGLAEFDYIDCCGVLHHLEQPAAGLAALVAALAPGGGLGLMVYAPHGRSGVYETQDLLRRLTAGQTLPEQIATARRLLAALPPTNRLKRNPFVRDHLDGGDAGLVDLLLHSQDRSYTVSELVDLLAGAGLCPAAFIEPAAYDPVTYLSDARLRPVMAGWDLVARAAAAEDIAGSLKTHVVYATAEGPARVASADDPEMVPLAHRLDLAALAAAAAKGAAASVTLNGIKLRLDLPRFGPALLARIDGGRSLNEICGDLGRPWEELRADWLRTFRVLNGVNGLLLSKPR